MQRLFYWGGEKMFADDGSYSIIRGDADTIVVKLFEDTEQKTPYNPVAADVIDFTVKKVRRRAWLQPR
jgi:hypothetical protein